MLLEESCMFPSNEQRFPYPVRGTDEMSPEALEKLVINIDLNLIWRKTYFCMHSHHSWSENCCYGDHNDDKVHIDNWKLRVAIVTYMVLTQKRHAIRAMRHFFSDNQWEYSHTQNCSDSECEAFLNKWFLLFSKEFCYLTFMSRRESCEQPSNGKHTNDVTWYN